VQNLVRTTKGPLQSWLLQLRHVYLFVEWVKHHDLEIKNKKFLDGPSVELGGLMIDRSFKKKKKKHFCGWYECEHISIDVDKDLGVKSEHHVRMDNLGYNEICLS